MSHSHLPLAGARATFETFDWAVAPLAQMTDAMSHGQGGRHLAASGKVSWLSIPVFNLQHERRKEKRQVAKGRSAAKDRERRTRDAGRRATAVNAARDRGVP